MNIKTFAIIAAIIVIVVAIFAVVHASNNDKHESGNYYVTYYGNGGITDDNKTSYILNKTYVDSNYFTREGYDFVCWNTEPDGSGTEYHAGNDVARGTNLYAMWKEKSTE